MSSRFFTYGTLRTLMGMGDKLIPDPQYPEEYAILSQRGGRIKAKGSRKGSVALTPKNILVFHRGKVRYLSKKPSLRSP